MALSSRSPVRGKIGELVRLKRKDNDKVISVPLGKLSDGDHLCGGCVSSGSFVGTNDDLLKAKCCRRHQSRAGDSQCRRNRALCRDHGSRHAQAVGTAGEAAELTAALEVRFQIENHARNTPRSVSSIAGINSLKSRRMASWERCRPYSPARSASRLLRRHASSAASAADGDSP